MSDEKKRLVVFSSAWAGNLALIAMVIIISAIAMYFA
jgi:hypothetical protein